MRIQVVGNSPAVEELTTLLRAGGYSASRTEGTYSIHLDNLENSPCRNCNFKEIEKEYITIDGVEGDFERLALNYIFELGVPKINLLRGETVNSNRLEVKLSEKYSQQVSIGLYRAIDKMLNKSSEPNIIPKVKGKFLGIFSLLLLLGVSNASAQNDIIRFWNPTLDQIVAAGDVANNALRVNVIAGGAGGGLSQLQVRSAANAWTDVGFFAGNLNVPVNCVVGCSAGGSFTDSTAFSFGSTSVSNTSFVVDDVATNTVAENSAGAARMNTNRILYIDLSKTVANTNKLLVTPDSVALPANQSVNVNQFGGTNVVTGTGASGAGIPRVTISNDSSLAANQSVNTAQVNGVTTLAGSGDVGTGAQRIVQSGNPTITSGQASITTSSTQVAAARAGRQAIVVTNLSAVDIYLGPSGVTTSTGTLLLGTKGTSISFPFSGALFAVSSSGTNTVTYAEIY